MIETTFPDWQLQAAARSTENPSALEKLVLRARRRIVMYSAVGVGTDALPQQPVATVIPSCRRRR